MITTELSFITFYMRELKFVETDISLAFFLMWQLFIGANFFFQQKTKIKRTFYVEHTLVMTGNGHL